MMFLSQKNHNFLEIDKNCEITHNIKKGENYGIFI